MVYGIVTLGMKSDSGDSYFVKTFQLRTSVQKDCDGMVIYGGTNTVIIQFKQVANCSFGIAKVKITPQNFQVYI